ncbi:unnamed protein product, partial [Angiostrongylus costaricensis]|uniref:EGF-like domain-containing protein n=1 Tax=Angiostrongylus costaricensis TaxID=334426 RepID=A0A0R3PZ05_ANGCS
CSGSKRQVDECNIRCESGEVFKAIFYFFSYLLNLNSCKAKDCNNRGTCLGTKAAYVCACVLGYTGRNCEETVCDSSRDCNGRGICFGTTNSLTCLCNLGYLLCRTPF